MPDLDKKYTFDITAKVVGDDGVEMFDAHVSYKNMDYSNVVVVEGAIVQMLGGLKEFAEAKVSEKSAKVFAPGQLKK